MVVGKKSQAIIVFIMVGIIVFIMAVAFSQPLKQGFDSAMNVSSLNCSNPDNTINRKAECAIVDAGLFYFIAVVIATGLAVISGRKNITSILTTIFVFIAVVVLITPLKDLIVYIRDADHLNCAAASITVGQGLACLFIDIWLFYFVVLAIASTATLFVIKKVTPEE